MEHFFIELSMVLALTVVISIIFSLLKQPLIVAYIFSGIIAGPLFLNIFTGSSTYEAFAHIGVALLLFIVGLHLNLKLIKEIGISSLIIGFFQVLFTVIFSLIPFYFFGFSFLISILLGFSLAFSSTIVVVKVLSDKKELESVHGKITMGILIFQDLIAVLLLMILAAVSTALSSNFVDLIFNMLKVFLIGIILSIIVLFFSKIFLEKVFDRIAQNQDLFFVFILSWCFFIAALFNYFGFSLEIGALIAGIALASTPYQFEISSKVKPLRDFFLIIFFVLLGSQMIPVSNFEGSKLSYLISNFSPIFLPALILSFFVLVIKPIIIYIILNVMNFNKREAFLSAISLSQVSEFSLIMLILSKDLGLVTLNEISMITLVAIITITISTYLTYHSYKLYNKYSKFLDYISFRNVNSKHKRKLNIDPEVIIFGYDRIGSSIVKELDNLGKRYLIIDYNPKIIELLEKKKIPCVYGDASDINFLEELETNNLKLVISTIPNFEVNLILLNSFRKRNKSSIIILTSNEIDSALDLYKEGADYVILPHYLGGSYISHLLKEYHGNYDEFLKEKVKHIVELKDKLNK